MSSHPVLLWLPGDGYGGQPQSGAGAADAQWLEFLRQHEINVIFVPLQEEDEDCTYEQLDADAYCDYIDQFAPSRCPNLWCGGISKGAHWARVYASKRPGRVKKLLLIEETTMTPELMVKYEQARGNDYVEELYDNPNEIDSLNATDKALDAIVSDRAKYCPRGIPIHIVFTSRNNMNEPYPADVVSLKNRYVSYLKRNGCQVRLHKFNSDHCIDTHPEFFPQLLGILNE